MRVDQATRPFGVSGFGVEVVHGARAGSRIACNEQEVVLGRKAAGSALFRGDATVSRRHAILRHFPDGSCLIDDIGSANGIFVNGVLIDQPTVLGPTDEFRIGSTRLRLTSLPADVTVITGLETSAKDDVIRGAAGGEASRGATRAKETQRRKARQLSLPILAAIAGTVLTSALNGPPQLRLVAAAVGAAIPAFVTEPGRHQRERVVAATLLMAVALGVTYGGATLFSYAANRPPVFPIPKIVSHAGPTVAPTPSETQTSPPTPPGPTVRPMPAPSLRVSPTPIPTGPAVWPMPSSQLTSSPSPSPVPNPAGTAGH